MTYNIVLIILCTLSGYKMGYVAHKKKVSKAVETIMLEQIEELKKEEK